jgi:deazaflavin-dependent oxidoreductase (nitroreductase family)
MSDWNHKIIEEFREKGGKGVGPFGDQLALLTTRGAKSGKAHTTPLAFHRDHGRYVVIASMGGAPKHPAWYHNLLANPDAELEVGNEKFRVHATPVAGGAERDRLYEQQAQIMPGFREYEKKTTRIIPAVVLERVENEAAAA